MENNTNEFIIQKLNELLYKEEIEERKKKKKVYVKKTQCYKDLIKFFEEFKMTY